MKKLNRNRCLLLLFAIVSVVANTQALAQEEKTEKPEQVIKLRYFNQDNELQFVLLESQLKTGKKTEPRGHASIRLYLDSVYSENLIATVSTPGSGKAKAFLPASLKNRWDENDKHTFIVIEEVPGNSDETSYSLEIQKARILLDTSSVDSIKNITVHVSKYENNEWVSASDVEMRIGVERLGGILGAGADDTYTTDSSGNITMEFNKLLLPGNEKGNIVLMARVDDNEFFGNLQVKKTVPWGVATLKNNNFFNQRTLWSTRFKTPLWLLFMATSIVAGVWGVLLYLVIQLIRIIKLGSSKASAAPPV